MSRFLPTLLVAGSLLPLLASCGGGGGGGGSKPATIDTGTNTNTPIPIIFTPTDSCNYESFAPNYAPSVDLLHWSVFPLRVHFVRNDQLSASRQQLAVEGFNQWVSATEGRADYTVVESESSANVVVSFYRFTGGAGDTLGTTRVTYDSRNVIRRAKIELGITGNRDEDIATAAHEYGHALGITGHSPSSADLMFFTGNLSGDITRADLNTVLTAYCNDFNRNQNRTKAAVGPLKTLVIH